MAVVHMEKCFIFPILIFLHFYESMQNHEIILIFKISMCDIGRPTLERLTLRSLQIPNIVICFSKEVLCCDFGLSFDTYFLTSPCLPH